MIVFISFYNYKNNLLYLIFYGYCYGIFHRCHKNWKIRENDTERYFILDLNAIPMLKYRSLKKIDWAWPSWHIYTNIINHKQLTLI